MTHRWTAVLTAVLLTIGTSCHRSAMPSTSREADAMLFSYFTRNGEDGLHLAFSNEGTTWQALNGGRSLLTPTVMGRGVGWQDWDSRAALMRDPSLAIGYLAHWAARRKLVTRRSSAL